MYSTLITELKELKRPKEKEKENEIRNKKIN
jgi:hypothetical protein